MIVEAVNLYSMREYASHYLHNLQIERGQVMGLIWAIWYAHKSDTLILNKYPKNTAQKDHNRSKGVCNTRGISEY